VQDGEATRKCFLVLAGTLPEGGAMHKTLTPSQMTSASTLLGVGLSSQRGDKIPVRGTLLEVCDSYLDFKKPQETSGAARVHAIR